MLDLAAPAFIADRDAGDEHQYKPLAELAACPECGCPRAPEPSAEERQRLFDDADYHWSPPDGEYLSLGYGLMGGGFGLYAWCDRCGWFHKEQASAES